MKIKAIRSRVVGGCLTTIMLTATGSLLAKSAKPPTFDLCSMETHRMGTLTFGAPSELFSRPLGVEAGGAPAPLGSINAMAPWFHAAVVPFRVDGLCPVAATVEAPALQQLAVTEAPPGVVHNLRRTDLR